MGAKRPKSLVLLNKDLIYRPPFLHFFFHILQVVTELDAFPKVEETYVEQTATGASGRWVILYISGLYCTFIALLYVLTHILYIYCPIGRTHTIYFSGMSYQQRYH